MFSSTAQVLGNLLPVGCLDLLRRRVVGAGAGDAVPELGAQPPRCHGPRVVGWLLRSLWLVQGKRGDPGLGVTHRPDLPLSSGAGLVPP